MTEIPRRRLLGGLALAFGWDGSRDGMGRRGGDGTGDAERFADAVVSTTAGLEAAFDDLSGGETIAIAGENAPYRTTRWLDVDVDGVTVVGADVPELVKPADGADVGGFRVGHSDHCENVTIRGVGYDGNTEGQSASAKWRHGIVVQDAANVTLAGNYLTRTHPYREHGSGGSGISAERGCRNVSILGNRIHDVGDRGIQVAGEHVVVSENVVTKALDRSISCDVWRDHVHHQARNVAVVGNVLGNNLEGSLIGLGGNDNQTDGGQVLVADNVGFGSHKSFCHVGFDGGTHTVRIAGNVSVQEQSIGTPAAFAGVSVDIERASNVTVADNDLSGYGGPGVKLGSGVSDFAVTGNRLADAGSDGVRIEGATDGVVARNAVSGAGRAGVLLDGARFVSVERNRIRGVQRSGIVVGGRGRTHHAIERNHVREYGREDGSFQGILLRTGGNVVRGNRIHQRGGGPAIVEGDGGGDSVYDGNWANGPASWLIESPTSLVRDHVPAFDAHRGLVADESGTVAVRFEKPYDRRPRLTFGRVGGGLESVSYWTTASGAFGGTTLSVGSPGARVDVFVEPP